MNIWLKVALGLLGTAVLVFVALAVTVTLIFEPNDYRPYLVDAVQDATGRSFQIEGDLGLTVFPCCSVSIGPSRLGNPPGFGDEAFAGVRAASLSMKLWPLLAHQRLEIGTVTLDGVELSLLRRADGRVNWSFDSASEAAPENPSTVTIEAETELGLAVDGVEVHDSQVSYRDEQSGQHFILSDIDVRTGAITDAPEGASAPAIPVEADVTLTDRSDGTGARIDLVTQLALDGDWVTALNTTLVIEASGARVPGGRAKATLTAERLKAWLADEPEVNVEALAAEIEALGARAWINGGGRVGSAVTELAGDFSVDETSPRALLHALAGEPYRPADDTALRSLAVRGRWGASDHSAAIEGLDLRLDDSHLTGALAVDDLTTLAGHLTLDLDRIDLDRYLATESKPAATPAAGGEPTRLPLDSLAGVRLDGKLRIGALRASGIDLDGVELTLARRDGKATVNASARALGGSVRLTGSGDVGAREPALAGTLTLADIAPRRLLAALDADVPTANPAVLAHFAGTSDWRLTSRDAALEHMHLTLDDSTFSGALRIIDFDTLASRLNMRVDRMNVDDYLAPEADDAAAAEADSEIPVDTLRGLDLRGRLHAGRLTVLGLSLGDVAADLIAQDGVLRLDPLTAALYGGTYQGSVVVDATGAKAKLTLDQQLTGVQAGQILGDLFGTDVLGGSLSLQLAGAGSGNTVSDLLRGLGGNLSFDLTDGVYRGTNLLYEVQRAKALFKKEAAPEKPAKMETPLRALALRGSMADGVLRTDQLNAETKGIRLSGKGGLNLLDLSLDYKLDAQVPEKGAAAAGLSELAGVAVPLTLSGPLTGPKVGVDVRQLAVASLRNKARDVLLDKLGGDTPAAPAEGEREAAAEEAKPPSNKELLKRSLRDLLKPREKDDAEPADSGKL